MNTARSSPREGTMLKSSFALLAVAAVLAILAIGRFGVLTADADEFAVRTYTENADFDEGAAINVVHGVPGQLQLDDTTKAFPFIWVAASARGTIVKIDTDTGEVLGEYYSSPDGRGRNPSRTTVDKNGNVRAGNRNESAGGKGAVVP